MNAGQKDGVYPNFVKFTTEEIEKHIFLYVFQGLSPSPRVEMKFKSQERDCVNGNDFIARHFPNGAQRHKQFKCFLSLQDPRIYPPYRKTHPNFKFDPFLKHVQEISMEAWLLGVVFSVDEQTMGFKGNHADKLRITYKKEGDGFQCDALCQDGYTFTFYFRNQPVPKK